MKKIVTGIFIGLVLSLIMTSTALAIDIRLPSGDIITDLPDQAGNAANSGQVVEQCYPPYCGT